MTKILTKTNATLTPTIIFQKEKNSFTGDKESVGDCARDCAITNGVVMANCVRDTDNNKRAPIIRAPDIAPVFAKPPTLIMGKLIMKFNRVTTSLNSITI